MLMFLLFGCNSQLKSDLVEFCRWEGAAGPPLVLSVAPPEVQAMVRPIDLAHAKATMVEAEAAMAGLSMLTGGKSAMGDMFSEGRTAVPKFVERTTCRMEELDLEAGQASFIRNGPKIDGLPTLAGAKAELVESKVSFKLIESESGRWLVDLQQPELELSGLSEAAEEAM